MFLSQTHLPQLLSPEHYVSPEHHDRELDRLFRPAWHFVGTVGDAPCDGDYFTTTLLGEPLIVWNRDGRFHAFLNVCPHRFSTIADAACGHAGERLQCPYHGWEFDQSGRTRRIPDARSFRPLEQGGPGLTRYRAATCGQLIFVTLADEAPELEEFFDGGYEVGCDLFGDGWEEIGGLDYEIEANWKIKIENTIESYHIDMVHPKTFIRMPPAEVCAHRLESNGSLMTVVEDAPTRTQRLLDQMVHRLAGHTLDNEFRQYIYYPGIMFGKIRFSSWIEVAVPVAPTRCRILLRSFWKPGRAGRIRSKIAKWGVRKWSNSFGRIAAQEDAAAILRVQRGMSARTMPSPGLLSIREERLFHFQNYIRQAVGEDAAHEDGLALAAGEPA